MPVNTRVAFAVRGALCGGEVQRVLPVPLLNDPQTSLWHCPILFKLSCSSDRANTAKMVQTEIMPAMSSLVVAAGGIVSAGYAQAGLFALAFALGILTALALMVVWKALTIRKAKADGRGSTAAEPLAAEPLAAEPLAADCLGPAITAAVQSGELQLHYQPKLDCRTMRLCGAEALSRWTLPDGTALPPEDFVAQAEAVGGIAELTVWGVEQALHDSAKLAEGSLGGPIFVNLSGKLITTGFVTRLVGMVGDQAARIGFEITETAVLDNPEEALQCLHILREAGIRLAIDDYGAGLSSLSYLKQIPAGELKIDRKFIQGMVRSNRDPLIVRSTIDLCHGLGMTVTAEGVEDAMTASLLRVMGCDTMQGYFVSKAVSIDALIRFVDEHSGSAPQVPQIRKIVNAPDRG